MGSVPAGEPEGPQRLRIFWARMRLRIRFLRHFQRMCPRFFQTLEERFMPRRAGGGEALY